MAGLVTAKVMGKFDAKEIIADLDQKVERKVTQATLKVERAYKLELRQEGFGRFLRQVVSKVKRKGADSSGRVGTDSNILLYHEEGTGRHGKGKGPYEIRARTAKVLAIPNVGSGGVRQTGKVRVPVARAQGASAYNFIWKTLKRPKGRGEAVIHPGVKDRHMMRDSAKKVLSRFDWSIK